MYIMYTSVCIACCCTSPSAPSTSSGRGFCRRYGACLWVWVDLYVLYLAILIYLSVRPQQQQQQQRPQKHQLNQTKTKHSYVVIDEAHPPLHKHAPITPPNTHRHTNIHTKQINTHTHIYTYTHTTKPKLRGHRRGAHLHGRVRLARRPRPPPPPPALLTPRSGADRRWIGVARVSKQASHLLLLGSFLVFFGLCVGARDEEAVQLCLVAAGYEWLV